MNNFEFFFGIGLDPASNDLLKAIRNICPEIQPYYLVSCADMKRGDEIAKILGVTAQFVNSRIFLDSGGWSLHNYRISTQDLTGKDVAMLVNNNAPSVATSADIPIGNVPFKQQLASNLIRVRDFYANLDHLNCKAVLDVAHGGIRGAQGNWDHTLDNLDGWIKMHGEIPGNCRNGLAMKVPDDEPEAVAVAALFPASRGFKFCHVLKAGSIEYMGAYIFAATAYNHLTTDATNYTIQATNALMYVPVGGSAPKPISWAKSKLGKFETSLSKQHFAANICKCNVCAMYRLKYNTSVQDLAISSAKGTAMDGNSRLYHWLAAHNVTCVQGYINSLRSLASDPKALIEHQLKLGLVDGVKAIEHMVGLMKFINNRNRFDKIAIGLLDFMWGCQSLRKGKRGE